MPKGKTTVSPPDKTHAQFLKEGINFKQDGLQVFSQAFDAKDVELFSAFVKSRLRNTAYLFMKRIQGKLILEPELSNPESFLIDFCYDVVLPFAKCVSELNQVLLDVHFVRLLKYVSIILFEQQRNRREGGDILVELLRKLSQLDYKTILESQPILLELLVESCMYCYEFELAEKIISEIVRTITLIKNSNYDSRDRFILARFYMFWFACNPKLKNHLVTCNTHLNDARSHVHAKKLTKELSDQIASALRVSASLQKVKDAKSAVKIVFALRFDPNSKSGPVIKVVVPSSKFATQLSQITKFLRRNAPSVNKPVRELLNPENEVIEIEEDVIPTPKTDEDFKGEYNEFLHTYDAMKVKTKKRKIDGALGALAHQRALKKMKTPK